MMALTNQSTPQLDFLAENDEMFQPGDRSVEEENQVLTRVAYRILHLRDTSAWPNTTGTSTTSQPNSTDDSNPKLAVQQSQEELIQEIISTLRILDSWTPYPSPALQPETTNPPCTIADYGSQPTPTSTCTVSLDENDPFHRCAICADIYHTSHPLFQITVCAHVLGQPCLEKWLSTTSPNANRCPFCRAELYERPGRRFLDAMSMRDLETNARVRRLTRALLLLQDLDTLVADCFGWGDKDAWLDEVMCEVNWRLFEGGLGGN